MFFSILTFSCVFKALLMHLFHNFFGRWRIAQLVLGPAIVNRSLPANQEADSAVQTCQMQWRPAPWPRHHLFATTAGRFLRTQRTLPDISRSTTRGEFFLKAKLIFTFFCRDTTTSSHSVGSASATLPLPSTSATSAAASASMMDYNCPECTWSGRTKNVLTRHIRAKHQ